MNQAKVLLITRNFPPLRGGMERLNWRMAQELAKTHALHVVAPQGAAEHVDVSIAVTEVPLRPLWRFLLAATWQSLRQALRTKPEIVLAGSGLTAPLAWMAARLSSAQAVVYVHGLDIVAPHPVYRALWLPALRRMDRVIANSQATAQLAEQAGVDAGRIRIVHPGVDLPGVDFPAQASISRVAFRERYGLGEGAILLSVGRLTARKGLREFVREVLPKIVAQRPDVLLVVVGGIPHNALLASVQTPESIMQAAQEAGVGDHVRILGTLSCDDLADAYAGVDVHVFPVREIPNDPEGFGMVAIEAAAHGLPTAAYATGGVVDAVADGVSGRLVQEGDSHALADAILEMLRDPLPETDVSGFAALFSWPSFGKKLLEALKKTGAA